MNSIKTACKDFINVLKLNDMEREATDILSAISKSPEKIRIKSPLKNEKTLLPSSKKNEEPVDIPVRTPPSFDKSFSSAAPILELGNIIDTIKIDPTFKNLPDKMRKSILKIEKMTENAFKFASEKEAKTTLQKLQKVLNSFGRAHPDLAPNIVNKLTALQNLVDNEVSGKKETPSTKSEKEIKLPRGIRQRSRAQKDDALEMRNRAQKGLEDLDPPVETIQEDIQDKKPISSPPDLKTEPVPVKTDAKPTPSMKDPVGILKTKLFNHPSYSKIFYRLPASIIKELNRAGLGLDSLNSTVPVKVASHINNVLSLYLNSKNKIMESNKMESDLNKLAVKASMRHAKKLFKNSMDFSGIDNLITPKNKLNDREIARTLRLAIAAELDAVHLYELIVDATKDKNVKKVLQDIADEEKVHVGELQELLKQFDSTDEEFLEEGKKEVEELKK